MIVMCFGNVIYELFLMLFKCQEKKRKLVTFLDLFRLSEFIQDATKFQNMFMGMVRVPLWQGYHLYLDKPESKKMFCLFFFFNSAILMAFSCVVFH